MFKAIQAKLEMERDRHRNALAKLQAYDPADDPQINAKGASIIFIQSKIGGLSRDIDAYRVTQLCLNNMEPVTTPAGPASPVPVPAPEPVGDDG